jgi:UPF0716 protein FxsA
MGKLFLLFTLIPLIELALLIKIGQVIDLGPTIALVLITGVVGAFLARLEGLRTFTRIRSELFQGRMPADSLIDAMLILAAGILLVTPGVLTDAVGLLLLLPPTRALVRRRLKTRMLGSFRIMTNIRAEPADEDWVDVESTPVESKRLDPGDH